MARRRNGYTWSGFLEEEALFLWAVGAGVAGTMLGYGMCHAVFRRRTNTWKYWVAVTQDGFVPWIEDSCGHQQSFEAQPTNELAEMQALQMMPPEARPKKTKSVLG